MGLMLSCAAFAQPYPEKVYVHLDRTYFAAGEIIWLKGYVEDVLPEEYASLFLYVELLASGKDEPVLRVKIRREGDGFAGHLDLPEEMPGGRYLLRAYTRWQLNWPEERLFHVPIDIYAGQDLAAVTGGGQVVASTAPVVPLAVSWDTPAYEPRRHWNLHVLLPEEAAADSAEVSVSVVRQAFRAFQQEEDLASCFHAGFPTRVSADNSESPRFRRERTQSLHGEVRSFFKAQPRNYTLTVIAPECRYTQVEEVKRGRRFFVDSLDFPDGTLFIIHVDNSGERKRYYPVLEESFAPAPTRWPAPALRQPASPDSARTATVSTGAEIPFTPGDVQRDTIQTAVIQDAAPRIKTPFGTSDVPNIKKREELSQYDNRNLLDYILMNYQNLEWDEDNGQIVNRKTGVINKNGVSYSTVSLFVDGFKTSWDMAGAIMMSDIDRLSVTTTLNSDALMARSYGGIVLVQLRVEAGRKSLLQQSNTIVATPLGWQKPKVFPDPAKERSRSLAIPDRRNTVYWNPSVRLRAGKPVDIPLVTEDRADGPYLLRIEGRTAEGRWISQEYTLR